MECDRLYGVSVVFLPMIYRVCGIWHTAITGYNHMRGARMLMQFAKVICLTLLLSATVEAQTGPIRVDAGATQVVVRVPQGKVEIKRQGTHGSVAQAADPTLSGRTEIFYTAQKTSDSVNDSFSYTVDNGSEQDVSLAIEPATFDLDRGAYEKIFKALFLLFVLALALESGLALIFNWRPFVETFNARATKPLVSFIFAYAFVTHFHLDLMASILAAASSQAPPPSTPGRIITALVLAGGSAGINNILVSLGLRPQRTPESVAPKPPASKAWVAFRLARSQAVGPVEVFVGPTPAALPGTLPLAGVIEGTSTRGVRFFFRDRGRFPPFAGHEVPPGVPLSFELVGKTNNTTQPIVRARRDSLIVETGAVIDLEIRL